MRIDIVTLFPEMFFGPFSYSMVRKATEKRLCDLRVHQLRDWTSDPHHTCDDYPFGGGPGMILKPEPVFAAVESLQTEKPRGLVILTSPLGRVFNQQLAADLARVDRLIILCGHYEGVDERIRERLVDEEISLGDFVITGGELAAMVMVDAVVRLLPGVLEAGAAEEESFSRGLLEYPQYTRPQDFRGMKVPAVLLSGNHEAIRRWRRKMSLYRTKKLRPDLLAAVDMSAEDQALLAEAEKELASPGSGLAGSGRAL